MSVSFGAVSSRAIAWKRHYFPVFRPRVVSLKPGSTPPKIFETATHVSGKKVTARVI